MMLFRHIFLDNLYNKFLPAEIILVQTTHQAEALEDYHYKRL